MARIPPRPIALAARRGGRNWSRWPEFKNDVPSMKSWPLQEAKNQFSQMVELARTEGPQAVTRHGEPVAVILAANEFKRMARPEETILEFFAPLKSSGIKLRRDHDLPRRAEL